MGVETPPSLMAFVDSDAIGEGTTIYQFASIVRGAEIGKNCVVGPCSLVDMAHVGDNCRISHGASINPGSWLEDEVFIGPNVVICNDMWPKVSKKGFTGRLHKIVIVCEGASIGAGAILLPGVKVGKGSLIAANAVVSRSVPEKCLYTRDGSIVPLPENPRRMRYADDSDDAMGC